MTVEVTRKDWEETIDKWIGVTIAQTCSFCKALRRKLSPDFSRGDPECRQCAAYSVCGAPDSLYEQYAFGDDVTSHQARLAILEWLYDFGKKHGWIPKEASS